MTNYEKIKAMSVEEMAEWICGIYDTVCEFVDEQTVRSGKFICGVTIPDYDEIRVKEFLESEVEEDG